MSVTSNSVLLGFPFEIREKKPTEVRSLTRSAHGQKEGNQLIKNNDFLTVRSTSLPSISGMDQEAALAYFDELEGHGSLSGNELGGQSSENPDSDSDDGSNITSASGDETEQFSAAAEDVPDVAGLPDAPYSPVGEVSDVDDSDDDVEDIPPPNRGRGRGGVRGRGRARGRGNARGRGRGQNRGRGRGRGLGAAAQAAGGAAQIPGWNDADNAVTGQPPAFHPVRPAGIHLPDNFAPADEIDFSTYIFLKMSCSESLTQQMSTGG